MTLFVKTNSELMIMCTYVAGVYVKAKRKVWKGRNR